LFQEDWDHFGPYLDDAMKVVPILAETEIECMVNGPESFTGDNQYIIGESPELRDFWIAAGFNSAGIASSAGVGHVLSDWIIRVHNNLFCICLLYLLYVFNLEHQIFLFYPITSVFYSLIVQHYFIICTNNGKIVSNRGILRKMFGLSMLGGLDRFMAIKIFLLIVLLKALDDTTLLLGHGMNFCLADC